MRRVAAAATAAGVVVVGMAGCASSGPVMECDLPLQPNEAEVLVTAAPERVGKAEAVEDDVVVGEVIFVDPPVRIAGSSMVWAYAYGPDETAPPAYAATLKDVPGGYRRLAEKAERCAEPF